MCFLCMKNDDYSVDHLAFELKKAKKEELKESSNKVKDLIKSLTIYKQSGHCDGFEVQAIESTLENLKAFQYAMSRFQ